MVGNLLASDRGAVSFVVEVLVPGKHFVGIARHGIALVVGHTLGILCRKHVVERVVRVFAESEIVVAFAEYVRLCGSIVIRGQEILIYRNFQGFVPAVSFEHTRLIEGYELNCRLFYTICLFVVAVGRLRVQFDHRPAIDVARIGHRHRCGEGAVAVVCNFVKRLRKRGIREAVTEGISHLVGIVPAAALRGIYACRRACVALAENAVFVAGFVILIAHIDALGIDKVIVIAVLSRHIVLHCGCRKRTCGERVHEFARGVCRTREQIGNAVNAAPRSGAAYPHTGVD